MDDNAPSILKPTLIGGVAAGLAGAIPIVNFLNCLCCSIVVAGGFLAGYLYSKECGKQGIAFGPANGATVGLVAAFFYALTGSVMQGLYHLAGLGPDVDQILEQLEQANLPPDVADKVLWALEKFGTGFSILGFLLTLLIAAVFSTVGGVIAGMTFKVEPPPPAASAPIPPPPPPSDPSNPA